MSRSCHSATSCRPACRLPRSTRDKTGDRLGRDRVALVGHRRRALLARLETLLHLAHLGALQVAQLDGDQLARRADRGAGLEVLGVAVAGDHLRRRHRRSGRARSPTCASTAGSMFEYVPTAPLSLHTATDSRAARRRVAVAVDLQRPQRHLGAERRRLGVDAVGAADHHRVAVRRGPASTSVREQLVAASSSRSAASRSIQHSAVSTTSRRRQAVVDPRPAGRADRRLHDVDERGDVVVGDRLALERPRATNASSTTGAGHGRRRRRAAGTTPSAAWRLGGQQFDLEPPAEARDVATRSPSISGVRVARDHDGPARR